MTEPWEENYTDEEWQEIQQWQERPSVTVDKAVLDVLADECRRLRQDKAALLAALKNFVDYYDLAGIPADLSPLVDGDDWEELEEKLEAVGVSSDEAYNVLVARNAIQQAEGESRPCPYGHRDATGVCRLGYPGCACMDDMMAADAIRQAEGE